MPITELLEKNAQMYGDEVSLVEINPKAMEHAKVTWSLSDTALSSWFYAESTEHTRRQTDGIRTQSLILPVL